MSKTEATLVFPHQLFENNPAVNRDRKVFLIEDPLFFNQYDFHKKKLVLHRASMQFYLQYLEEKGVEVEYIETSRYDHASLDKLMSSLSRKGISNLHITDPIDYLLERRLTRSALKNNVKITQHESPCFLNTSETVNKYFENHENYFLHHFYVQERKRLNILVSNGKPVGGQWSFDAENRKKIPKNFQLPKYRQPTKNRYVKAAETYVNQKFNNNYGVTDDFIYPTTFQEAREWFDAFLQQRFFLFGPYEDAMLKNESFLFHSVLSSSLNIGLITPGYVLERVQAAAIEFKIPISSLEGFIRQIIGWREFIRGVYKFQGTYQRKRNFWNHSRTIPKSFYTGTTGILPVDIIIKRVIKNAYSHHIERLMVMGNFMLLCEFDPDAVYKWFMELYIDAYDWVMVPNVYGMSQFADGGLMSTKPYLSSSNYIMKMSDFPKSDWCDIWNALYWRFIYKHRDFFSANQRSTMIVKNLERMDKSLLKKHIQIAEKFLNQIDQKNSP